MIVSFITTHAREGIFPCTGKKGEGVGGKSKHWIPDRASDAQRLNVGLMVPGSAEPKAELPGLQLASLRTEAAPPPRPRSRSKNPNAATPPRSCGPSPPRAGPRNRLRVTSPPPSPFTAAPAPPFAAARPKPRAPLPPLLLGPRLTARGALPAVAGGATLPQSTQSSSTRDRQLRAGCASRPSHGTSVARTGLAPSPRHGVRPVGTALPATQAAEGRAQEVTYAPAVAPPSPCRLSSSTRRGKACQAARASVPKCSSSSSPGLPIPARFQTHPDVRSGGCFFIGRL